MYCPNCGADLGSKAACPYCGYENEEAAQSQHKKEISAIYDKIAVLLNRPVEQARKITYALLGGTAALVVLFLLAMLGAFLYSKVNPDLSYQQQETLLQQLEACYQAQDYAAMQTILDDTENAYQSVYDKYSIIASMDQKLTGAEADAASYGASVREAPIYADLLQYPMSRSFEVLNQCRELEENGFVYEEEDAVRSLEARAQALLQETLLLTDEEIRQGMELQLQDEPDYTGLYEICAKRMRGEGS